MGLIIAADEAGYGPKLGPFVVAATVWQIDDAAVNAAAFNDGTANDFEDAFAHFTQRLEITPKLSLHITDSKKLFGGGSKTQRELESLELPLIGLVRACGATSSVNNLASLIERLAPTDSTNLRVLPWYARLFDPEATQSDHPEDLNQFPTTSTLCELATSIWEQVDDWFTVGSARPLGIAARIIDPRYFNLECQRAGNKATLLSEATLGLIQQCIEAFAEPSSIDVFCDRHGGRKSYGALLQHHFPESFPTILSENAHQSSYELPIGNHSSRWRFTVGGDSFVPVAAASIVAKYLRERLMHCVNVFWQSEHDGTLRPTAGYPVDANRFYEEIRPSMHRLQINESDILRSR